MRFSQRAHSRSGRFVFSLARVRGGDGNATARKPVTLTLSKGNARARTPHPHPCRSVASGILRARENSTDSSDRQSCTCNTRRHPYSDHPEAAQIISSNYSSLPENVFVIMSFSRTAASACDGGVSTPLSGSARPPRGEASGASSQQRFSGDRVRFAPRDTRRRRLRGRS